MSTANKKPAESVSINAFKQPKSFYLIFSIELWERFGFYGLQGIMAVYLVKQLGMSEADSITLFSSFSALVYGLVSIGGWLGDKVLGTKRVILLGAIVLAIGYALVAWSGHDATMPKTTRVLMALSPCITWRSISVRSSLCSRRRGLLRIMAGA